MQERSSTMYENLLVMLVYNNEVAPKIMNVFDLDYFTDPCYRAIATEAVAYYKRWGKVPERHIVELFDSQINGKDDRIRKQYLNTILYLHANKDKVHPEYVLSKLEDYVNTELLTMTSYKIASAVRDKNMDEAFSAIKNCSKKRLEAFNEGTRLSDVEKVLDTLRKNELYVPTGIKELNHLGICPTPGELFVFTSLTNKGKTWFLMHLARNAFHHKLLNGEYHNILHVSLEMSEGRLQQRYMQTFFGASKRVLEKRFRSIFEDKHSGEFVFEPEIIDILSKPEEEQINYQPDFTFDGHGKLRAKYPELEQEAFLRKVITEKIKGIPMPMKEDGSYGFRVAGLPHDNLIIKEFATGSLTMESLHNYLDDLAETGFIPDIMFVDYPDLMRLDTKYLRFELARVYRELRGIAIERHLGMVVPCQSNKAGDTAKIITARNMGEAWDKITGTDNHITYNQTIEELKIGRARLYVDKCRNDQVGDTIMIQQEYSTGQFCTNSFKMEGSISKRYNYKFATLGTENVVDETTEEGQ